MLKIVQYLRKNCFLFMNRTNFLFCREYFLGNDSKKPNDENRKQHGASSSRSNADLITNHLNETTAAASKTTPGTPQ